MWKRLTSAFWTTDTKSLRFTIGLTSLFWAIMLFWPGATFERPTYTVMGQIADEHIWASVFLISGIYNVLNASGLCRAPLLLQHVLAFLNVALYVGTSLGMLLSVFPPPAAIAAHIALAIGAAWSWIRIDYPRIRNRWKDLND